MGASGNDERVINYVGMAGMAGMAEIDRLMAEEKGSPSDWGLFALQKGKRGYWRGNCMGFARAGDRHHMTDGRTERDGNV